MAWLGSVLVLSLSVWGLLHVETLDMVDSSFCHGGLKVVYPELDVDTCLTIPKAQQLREKVSTVWMAPEIYFSNANQGKTYVLAMVDPDAPSRSAPSSAPWRHWLVVDVQGDALKIGQIRGTTLTDYHPPTPPRGTGFHRYQFLLWEQPSGAQVSQEQSSRANWDLQGFVSRSNLGEPVAAVQFLTQNYQDA